MIFVPVKNYRTARQRYPRAYRICRVAGGFIALASVDDYLKWKASRHD